MSTNNNVIATTITDNQTKETKTVEEIFDAVNTSGGQSIDNSILNMYHTRAAIGNTVKGGSKILISFAGAAGDEDLTPPDTPQPLTGGDYNGYKKIPLAAIEVNTAGSLSIVNGGFLVGVGGKGDYRTPHAWVDMSSNTNANNVGFVFGIERGGMVYFSARVTGDRLNAGNDRTNVAGGGFATLEEGDALFLWGCAEKASTVTIYDCNLGLEMSLPDDIKLPT